MKPTDLKPLQGIFFRDFLNDHVPDIIKEIFIEKLYIPLIQKNDQIVVDVGANIGLFSLFFYPYASKIYAVEPSAMHCETLRKMLEFNKMDKVEVIQKALADKDGEMTFYHNVNSTAHSLIKLEGTLPETETVQTVSIGTLLKDIPHINVLKVDVEGAEGTLFANEGFDRVASKIDNIIVEFHPWTGITPALLMNTIRDRGFTVEQMMTQALVLWFKKI